MIPGKSRGNVAARRSLLSAVEAGLVGQPAPPSHPSGRPSTRDVVIEVEDVVRVPRVLECGELGELSR